LKAGLGLAALALLLSACGERPAATPANRTQVAALKDGPHTAAARKRVGDLASGDARAVSEAQQALMRLGRDAVPALVETLQGAHDARVKQLAAWMLGELGVAAEASLPVLQSLKLTGPSDVSALVTSSILRIQQWQACGLAGLPETAKVHLVGLYKGHKELDFQLGPSGHTTTEIDSRSSWVARRLRSFSC
jgi:HEAT repeat protein